MNIDGLSRDQKILLWEILEEKERRLKAGKAVYTPNEGQIQVHSSPAVTRIVTSGNGSGKTALAVNEALWAAQGFNPISKQYTKIPARVVVLLDHPEKVREVWLPELAKWTDLDQWELKKLGKPYVSQLIAKTMSTITFMFHDQKPSAFESLELDVLIADEPPPRHVYVALARGARRQNRDPKFLIVATPISQRWMRQELIDPALKGERKDVAVFKYGTDVNKAHLADGYIEKFSALLSEKEKQIRLHGEFYDLEGLALAHLFERSTHLIPPRETDDLICVLVTDPHPSKAHVSIILGCNPEGQLFYVDELKAKLEPRIYAQKLREFVLPYRIVDCVCDCLGSQDGTGGEGFKSFIQVCNEELAEIRVRMRPTTWDEKQDEAFIARIQDALYFDEQNPPQLRFFNDLPGIVRDIENVSWQKHRLNDSLKPKLDIEDCDFLACLKYGLAANLHPKRNREPVLHYAKGNYSVADRKREPAAKKKFRNQFRRLNARKAKPEPWDEW